MKKWILGTIFLGCALGAHAIEQDLANRFEWVRPIKGTFEQGQQTRLQVPSDVFGRAIHFPNDVRILSSKGVQWPFFLYAPDDEADSDPLVPEIRNRSFVSGRDSFLQFDLLIPQNGAKKTVHNQVSLKTTGSGFIRRVEVFSDDPTSSKGLMAVGYLIDFSRQSKARNDSISYPDSDVKRLHIRIYTNARHAEESFELIAATIHSNHRVPVKYQAVDIQEVSVSAQKKKKGTQVRIFDLGAENRPVERVLFQISTPSFVRSVGVYGRNKEKDSWYRVGTGEIHALEGDKQLSVKINARYRYLKINIFNYDDPSLHIESIRLEARPRYFVFEAASDGEASLYYRAWDLKRPHYDLEKRIGLRKIESLPFFQTAEASPNGLSQISSWRKFSKGLSILAVGGVSLLVMGVIVRMLKQQKESEDTE